MKNRIKKIIFRKLIFPLLNSKKSAMYKARGVAVGLGWAMTPLVGIQMALVLLTWKIAKYFKWNFSLTLALAWTWVTNVVTLPPVYYVFYVTGQIMRGNFNNISGYSSLKELISKVFLSDTSFVEQMEAFLKLLFIDWGISMFLGCVPWIILSVVVGYKLTFKYILRKEKKRQDR